MGDNAKTRALTSAVNGLVNRFGVTKPLTPDRQQEVIAKWKKAARQYSRSVARSSRDAVMARCQGYCEICGDFCPWTMELHHIVPVKNGGDGWANNLVALCPNCHAVLEVLLTSKGKARKFRDWMNAKYSSEQLSKFDELVERGNNK